MEPSYSNFGAAYVARGFELAFQPGVRRYAIIPLLLNILLFTVAIWALFAYAGDWIEIALSWLPDYLEWLRFLMWPFLVLAIIVLFAVSFTSVANIVAAPFNSLLAEKVEEKLTGERVLDGGVAGMLRDIPRIIGRELQKLWYFFPRFIGFFLLFLFAPIIGQVLWFLFAGWVMTIQYADYPIDNHKVPFNTMRRELWSIKGKSLTFGCLVAFLASIPLVNLVMIPVAVAGATSLWVDHLRQQTLAKPNKRF